MTQPAPAPLPALPDLTRIPKALRLRARDLAEQWSEGWRGWMGGGHGRWCESEPAERLLDAAGDLLRDLSLLLVGDRDALAETLEELFTGADAVEGCDVLCNEALSDGVLRWLRAAQAYAREVGR